eukprot:1688426-Lingulodinium_polyedra.AAC.1
MAPLRMPPDRRFAKRSAGHFRGSPGGSLSGSRRARGSRAVAFAIALLVHGASGDPWHLRGGH